MSNINIQPPCNIGDRFWIIAYRDRKIIQVKCIGCYVNVDPYNNVNERYVWIANVNKPGDYWKLGFNEFSDECFKTEEEAKKFL